MKNILGTTDKNSEGCTITYDSNGNHLTFEDSDFDWSNRYSWTHNGNRLTYNNSDVDTAE